MNDDKTRKTETQETSETQESTASTVTTTIERPGTETEADTRVEHSEADSKALTPLEEKVIRMRYGRSLKGHEALEFATGADMETRLKLALIESQLLDLFQADALDPDPDTGRRSFLANAQDD